MNGEDTGAKLRTRQYLSVSSTILRRNGSKHTVKQRVGDVRRSYDYISSRPDPSFISQICVECSPGLYQGCAGE